MAAQPSRRPPRGQAFPLLVALLTVFSAAGLFAWRGTGRDAAVSSVASGFVWVLPASAHAPGANGANWRTDLEVHNAGTTAATYTVELLARDAENLTPQSRTYTLSPQQSVRYVDALMGMFAFTGAAALRITASSELVMVTSRTYNQIGTNPWNLPEGSSFGQFVPAMTDAQAIGPGEEGRLIQLTQCPSAGGVDFRTNVGIVNATGTALDVTVDFYRADGTWLGTKSGGETRLRGWEFRQLNEAMGMWGTIGDGYAVVRPATAGGKLWAFATVIDNHASGDAFFLPAIKKAAGASAPTPTPTRTPTPPAGSTPTPTPPVTGGVINGPSGSTLTLAPGYKETGMTVSLSAASITPLVRGSETPVSSAVKVSVSGNEPLLAGGNFKITIPVTSTVSDPSTLMMKALLTTGVPYPVLGIYDAAARTYTAEVTGLWDGWVFGVVSEPGVGILSSAAGHGRETLGWRTPMDWGTCVFRVVKHTNVWSDAKIESDIVDPAWTACDELRNEGFRSPRLWIDSRTNTRIIHLSNDPAMPTMYAECWASSPLPWCDPNSPAFSTMGLTEEQLLLLGAIYYNVSEMAPFLVSPFFATPGGALAHEMTHGSMMGTDVRRRHYAKANGEWTHTLKAWSEGGATILEGTYSARGDRLGEGTVTVRVDPNPQRLDAAADDPEQGIYTKQDFLGWFAKKYTNGSMTFIRSMYEAMSDETNGQYGLPAGQYRALYRRAVDRTFRAISGKGLPDVYHEFALDRGYRRTAALSLRTGDALANVANLALFQDRQDWNPAIQPTLDVRSLPPLTTRLIRFPLPAAVLARQTFDFSVASSVDISATGVRVTVFREDAAGVMLPGGEIALTDPKQPVKVPMTPPVANLSILVSNTSVEDRTATVKLGTFGSAIFVGTWAPFEKQGNDCYRPAKLFAPPILAAVFVLDRGTLLADQEFLGLLDPKYGYTLTGSGAITGDTATLTFKEGWIDFDDAGVAQARLDMDVTWSGTRKPVPPESAAQGVTEYFEGDSTLVFRTSAPRAPCTTSFTSPKHALVGPCPKPHCQN